VNKKIKIVLLVLSISIFLFESFSLDINVTIPARIGLFFFLLFLNGLIVASLSLLINFASKIFFKKSFNFISLFLVIFTLSSFITIKGWYSLQTDEQLNRKLEKAPLVEDFLNVS